MVRENLPLCPRFGAKLEQKQKTTAMKKRGGVTNFRENNKVDNKGNAILLYGSAVKKVYLVINFG